jgi:SAM-dependent methyltransferase
MDGYDIVICDGCGTAFADGIPSQAEFDAYYRDFSKYDYQHRGGEESAADRERLEALADSIVPFIPRPDARILEIGCANGKLLSLIKQRGFPNVVGLDPSPACAQAAASLYGINVLTNTVFDLPSPKEPFDFLIAIGVLEHIRDLKPALARFREQLARGAIAFIAVPDAADLPSRTDAPFQEFSTEHINFFSHGSLANLMSVNGFKPTGMNPRMPSGVAAGVFSKADEAAPITFDTECSPGLTRYISDCRQLDEELKNRIRTTTHSGESILVWGVGTHTRRLLANGVLNPARIAAFIDSDPKYSGQTLRGVKILAPKDIARHAEPILVSSYGFQNEIAHHIRHQLGAPNRLILLYDLPGAPVAQAEAP